MSGVLALLLGAGTGGVAPTDPDFASVSSLLHFEGSDASTTFTDQKGITWTAGGDAQIDTAQAKYGGSSGLFDGTGDYIDTPDDAIWDMGSGDFTFEFWARLNSNSGTIYIMGQANNTSSLQAITVHIDNTAKFHPYCYDGASVFGECACTTGLSTGVWYHLAYVRSGTGFKAFVNGVSEATATSSSAVANIGNNFAIGRLGEFASGYFNGWIDECRVTKGVARYSANFTPSGPFPDS